MIEPIDKKSNKKISKIENDKRFTKYSRLCLREFEYNIINTKRYFIQINKFSIFLLKLFIYIILFPRYLSLNNTLKLRKMTSIQKITYTFFNLGYLNYISMDSQIMPKSFFVNDGEIQVDSNPITYPPRSYKYVHNKTRNITLTFEFNEESQSSVSFKSLFENMQHILIVDFSEFNYKINDMENMFKDCINLHHVDFGSLDTSFVTNMARMFYKTNLKYLDLSIFTTSEVTNMNEMFSQNQNLLYLNLKNFDTSKVTGMSNMFYNCISLGYLNLLGFKEKSGLEIENIFSQTKEDLIYCINSANSPRISNVLSSKTNPNSCSNSCFEGKKKFIPDKNECIGSCSADDTYKEEYLNLCYKPTSEPNTTSSEETDQNTPEQTEEDLTEASSDEYTGEKTTVVENTETPTTINENTEKATTNENTEKVTNDEIMENCKAVDFFKGLCQTNNQTLSIENKDNMINNIVENIINGNLDTLLSDIVSGDKNDFYIKEDDIIFQITTTENQNNNEYNNVSTINLGECENTLKGIYGIDPNASLIILKIDYFMEGLMIPIIGYEVFHPENKSKLNLDYCKDILINYNIPVSIDEDEASKYDPNSEYYNDECTTSKSEDGTDITLNDRQKEYNDNNMSLCENKCNFTEYNISSKKSVCMCEIKSKIYTISEILESKETVSKDFNTENITSSSSSNLNLMKCYNTLFSKLGLLKNLGNYILLLMILIFSASSIFFYKVGYVMLDKDIKQILLAKEKNEEKINIYNYKKQKKKDKDKEKDKDKRKDKEKNKDKEKDKDKDKEKRKKKRNRKSVTFKANPSRKSLRKPADVIDSVNTGKEMNIRKSLSKLELKKKKRYSMINPQIQNSKQQQIIDIIYTDYELNFLSYKEALGIDKRNFKQYYISLIRAKHPILFSFIPNKDYNSMIIKIDLFLIGFGVIYAMNALFFNESTIHQIYEDKGAYNFGYFLPKILLSFFIAHIFVTALKFIFLSERNILDIKHQETRNKAADQVDSVKRRLIIKYIVFYIAGVSFLFLFWYYLSSFGAVYQNSQIFLIINAFLSSFLSLLYPFFINLIPAFIRIYSLNNSSRECFYKANKYIQII